MSPKSRRRPWPVGVSFVLAYSGFRAQSDVVGFLLLAVAIVILFYFEKTRKSRLWMISFAFTVVVLRSFHVLGHLMWLTLLLIALSIVPVFYLKDIRRYYRKHSAYSVLRGLSFLGVAVAMGGFGWFPPLDHGKILFMDSLKYSLPLAILSTIVALRSERQSSSRTKPIRMLLESFFAFVPLWVGLGILLNGWLDASAPTMHLARVVNRYTSTFGLRSNHIRVASWRKGTESEVLDLVPHSMYDKAVPDGTTHMKVVTKPGRFGSEWVVSYEVE